MAKYCTHCGSEVNENAVVCINCGCPVNGAGKTQKKSNAVIFGILGIIFAWLFALAGHILSIIGIVQGLREYKETGKSTGLVLSIIGEVCAVISSVIGVVSALGLF